MIMFQIYFNDHEMKHELINIHEVYNLFSNSHNKTKDKSNLSMIKQTLHMQSESIIIEDFNLHHLF